MPSRLGVSRRTVIWSLFYQDVSQHLHMRRRWRMDLKHSESLFESKVETNTNVLHSPERTEIGTRGRSTAGVGLCAIPVTRLSMLRDSRPCGWTCDLSVEEVIFDSLLLTMQHCVDHYPDKVRDIRGRSGVCNQIKSTSSVGTCSSRYYVHRACGTARLTKLTTLLCRRGTLSSRLSAQTSGRPSTKETAAGTDRFL